MSEIIKTPEDTLPPSPNSEENVTVVDQTGRCFPVLYERCRSIDDMRAALGNVAHGMLFWAHKGFLLAGTWAGDVKPGVVIHLKLDIASPSPPLPPSPPPPPPPPPPPVVLPPPADTPEVRTLHNIDEIWRTVGTYKISGCGDQRYEFMPFSISAACQMVQKYMKLRLDGVPEKWNDLSGSLALGPSVIGAFYPEVNVGPVLSPDFNRNGFRWVMVLKGMIAGNPRQASTNIRGESMYQWREFPSLEHVYNGIRESLNAGFSIEGLWVEVENHPSDELLGVQFPEFFAAIGSKTSAK